MTSSLLKQNAPARAPIDIACTDIILRIIDTHENLRRCMSICDDGTYAYHIEHWSAKLSQAFGRVSTTRQLKRNGFFLACHTLGTLPAGRHSGLTSKCPKGQCLGVSYITSSSRHSGLAGREPLVVGSLCRSLDYRYIAHTHSNSDVLRRALCAQLVRVLKPVSATRMLIRRSTWWIGPIHTLYYRYTAVQQGITSRKGATKMRTATNCST